MPSSWHLLWESPAWSRKEKLLGTSVPPGGLATILVASAALNGIGFLTLLAVMARAIHYLRVLGHQPQTGLMRWEL